MSDQKPQESPGARSRTPLVLGALVLIAMLGAATWMAWPEPEPEPVAKPGDTGLDRDQTEDFMRTIGYVQ